MKNKYTITGMSCSACSSSVQKAVSRLEGVTECNVNLVSNSMEVTFENITDEDIINAVTKIGFGAKVYEEISYTAESKKKKVRLITSVIFLVVLMYVSMGSMMGLPIPSFLSGMQNAVWFGIAQLVLVIPIIVLNFNYFTSGFCKLFKGHPNMDTLVALGSTASVLYGVYAIVMMQIALNNGDMEAVHALHMELYIESAGTILTLVTVGKYIESRSKAKTSESLRMILNLSGKTALLLKDGEEKTISVNAIQEGDILLVSSGMSIPVDGIVIEGGANVDQSAITGESLPVFRTVDDKVISGTINKDGLIKMKATSTLKDSTISKIAEMVEDAANSKAPIARLADKVSGIFVPIVMALAVISFIVWLLIVGEDFRFALERGISVLVISCPCALGLATPIAIMVSTGVAAKNKILLKDAATFEMLHSVTTAVLDKTGTITKGELKVDKVCEFSPEFKTVLGSFEKQSNHPLAVAVSSYLASENVPITTPENFVTVAGKGIEATLDGVVYRCGNAKFVEEWGVSAGEVDTEGGSVIFAASKEKLLGYVTITDTVKETSKSAIEAFRRMGIKTVILTGDNKASGEKVRREVNADEVIADVLPIEKAQHVKALKEKGEKVLMVGDGINDAVALETADVGMAIGAGSDIAVESANIVLVRSELSDAVRAIELSHKTIRNIRMNLFWAFFYNAIAIPVAMGLLIYPFGIKLTPMIASAAMSFSSVFVVLNSLRLMNALKKK